MLLIPAALVGVGGYALAQRYDGMMKDMAVAKSRLDKAAPISNKYEPTRANAQTYGRQPTRVIPDVDLRGVPFYHVDYGSGSLSREYTEPVILRGQYSYPSL